MSPAEAPGTLADSSEFLVLGQEITFIDGRASFRMPTGWRPAAESTAPVAVEAARYATGDDQWAMCGLFMLTVRNERGRTQQELNRNMNGLGSEMIAKLKASDIVFDETLAELSGTMGAKILRFEEARTATTMHFIPVADGPAAHMIQLLCETNVPPASQDRADIDNLFNSFRFTTQ